MCYEVHHARHFMCIRVIQFQRGEKTCQQHYEYVDLKGQLTIINFVQSATHDMTLAQPDGPADT